MSVIPDFQIALRLVWRARFVTLSTWLLIALTTMVLLAAQFSGRQPATVALDVGLSTIRLMLPVLIFLMVQELFSREFERRYFLTSLTYPRPRHQFLVGRLLAIVAVVFGMLAAMAILLGTLTWFVGQGYAQGTPVNLGQPYLITIAFLALDLLVVTAMAILLSIFASSSSFVLFGTFGFMIAARSYSSIIAMLEREHGLVAQQEIYRESLGLLYYLLPDLASLDVRMIALYDTMSFLPEQWPMLILNTLVYGLTLMGAALWILHRRRFS